MARRRWIPLLLLGVMIALSAAVFWVLQHGRLLRKSPSWVVTSRPSRAEVLVDGQAAGTTPCELGLAAGTHEITLLKEHFARWTREIVVLEAQSGCLEAALRFIPYDAVASQESACDPVWTQDGILHYLTYADGELRPRLLRPNTDVPDAAFDAPGPGTAYKYTWAPQAEAALVCYEDPTPAGQRHCQAYSFRTRKWTDLTTANPALLSATAIAWSTDGRQLTYLLPTATSSGASFSEEGHNEGPQPCELWICAADGSAARRIAAWDNATGVVWSPKADRLAVESATLGYEENRIWLVMLDDGQAVEIPALGASGAVWSDDGEWLAMHALGPVDEIADGLWVCDEYGGQLLHITPDTPAQYEWIPNTHRLVYFSSLTTGGAACWSVDVDTGNRILLADSALLDQAVWESAISPDGTRIAFVGVDGWLHMLVLGEY